MPELPEVETTLRGITNHISGNRIQNIIIRRDKLRWPIPQHITTTLQNITVHTVSRRAKYLLLQTTKGTIIIHLGMSGCLKILHNNQPIQKHDHVDIVFQNNITLRYNDPRRFGCILWTDQPPEKHKLLINLGPEPLEDSFNHEYLFCISKKRTCPIKHLIMNSKVVVGAGNIYANEALFISKILPTTPANKVTSQQCKLLVNAIKNILKKSIAAGGTTLKDFHNADGKPGYFKQQLNIYGKENMPCPKCNTNIKRTVMQQRATYHCPLCQL